MRFIKKIVFFTAGLTMLAAPALAGKVVKWKLAETWPSTLTPLASPPAQVAEMVEAMSGGTLIIRV
ncbi:MAG: ABC transporter substrate-binding protein, partial [Candidatus Electrothrix sp. AR4]|nr:ABC transporter substrate-binding protein [Candidatus Electrothrix sp. AR4]